MNKFRRIIINISVNKSYIRKRITFLRKKNYSKNLLINFNKFFKFIKKKNIRSKTIGGYYPFNYELDILNILGELEKKKIYYFTS